MRRKRSRRRAVLARLMLLGASVVVAFVLGEVLVRLIPRLRVSMLVSQSHPRLGEVYRPGQRARYSTREFDHIVSINRHGQHDVEHAWAKPEGVFRILFLGDSFTEALQVPIEQMFYRQLEHRLNEGRAAEAPRYETIGLARSGWGPAQELVALKEMGLGYEPDLVVLCLLPDNDFSDSCRALKRYPYMPYFELGPDGLLVAIEAVPNHGKDSWVYRLCKRSQLVCMVRQNVAILGQVRGRADDVPRRYQAFLEDKDAIWQGAIETTLACVQRMDALCRERGIGFVCIALSSAVTLGQVDLDAEAQRYPAMRGVAFDPQWPYRLLGERLGGMVPYVSMMPAFKAYAAQTVSPLHFERDGHWTPEGHEVAATFLHEYLTAGGLLERGAEETK